VFCLWYFESYAQAYPLDSPASFGDLRDKSANIKRDFSLQNAQDDWSGLIAGIAPLVLLVGERVTKQHLRESTSRWDYYMLGATPFGLITSIISLLRLVSLPIVARLI